MLGNVLKLDYEIDPTIRGSGTISTAAPVSKAQALSMLDALLRQNGAVMVVQNGFYRVLPASTVAVATGGERAGTETLILHYARAASVAKLLEAYVQEGVPIASDPARNALLVGGDAETRAALIALARMVDVDALGAASYGLFPATTEDPAELAQALTAALQPGGTDSGAARIVALDHANAVLVIARDDREIAAASRLYRLIEATRLRTARSWHIHYLTHGTADSAAHLLTAAFPQRSDQSGADASPAAVSADNPVPDANPDTPRDSGEAAGPASTSNKPAATNPTSSTGQSSEQHSTEPDHVRIVAYATGNAIMTYATAAEEQQIEGILSRIDAMPRQVRIDATIAEVTTNEDLHYGSQFFHTGRVEEMLTTAATSSITPLAAGFSLFHIGQNGGGYALSALATIGEMRVLSSPQLTVVDNTPATLSVGSLVPYLSADASGLLTSETGEVVDNVNYTQTGTELDILPRIGNNGLVTLTISELVSQPIASTELPDPVADLLHPPAADHRRGAGWRDDRARGHRA